MDYEPEIKNRVESIKISYQQKWIRNGSKDFVETIAFPVKSRNNWRITITCKKNYVSTVPYLIAYDKHGITASHLCDISDNKLMHFNSHFFKRFRERGKLSIDKPEQVIKYFFKKNQVLFPCYGPREDGTQQLFLPVYGGVALGNFHPDTEICEFKTYVDNSLLGKNQLDEINRIWIEVLTEIAAEMQRRIDKRTKQK